MFQPSPLFEVLISSFLVGLLMGCQFQEAAADVEKAVEQFKRTGKMPPTVAKFSIFRKEYFVGEFVPCLLRSVL